uniref:Uncharacterized protein n=1 Tax=Myoviridae sp. ctwmI4 TaxID=2826710 RepID=A0A8S5LUQ0_9CAUD|nr:MAG TPA: hypothetical protein [Myoviridae sp. ctwmI4]
MDTATNTYVFENGYQLMWVGRFCIGIPLVYD